MPGIIDHVKEKKKICDDEKVYFSGTMSLRKLAGNAYKDIAKTPSQTEWPKQHPSIIIKIKDCDRFWIDED